VNEEAVVLWGAAGAKQTNKTPTVDIFTIPIVISHVMPKVT
jgi:hypothetical protein